MTVYVTDYGRHASVVVSTGPQVLTEYTYGDWTYFAEAKATFPNALAALFCSKQAALGRRRLTDPGDPARLAADLRASVQSLRVEADAVRDLSARLDARYEQQESSEIYNPSESMFFVKDPEHYSLTHNSNRMTARWLFDLGCNVCGPSLLSNFVVENRADKSPPPATRP